MICGSIPMMIFILASGYLFTVYLLLALAKRTGTKTVPRSFPSSAEGKRQQEISVRAKVTQVVNSQ
ncbi:hypothetical protein LC605_22485 [Nostoc sp. CHAB 5836]|uniref:hypothetical protein n=1 Tax=Nostoc sp. CHAB 5836 TaxID=2780404 RepID=UPI001E49D124|nr:hypothetical protein [Nostoc sp. CHAB 5836]MCC5617809.1 hypothetical protein [Nostoc sp. CHAB 5836]